MRSAEKVTSFCFSIAGLHAGHCSHFARYMSRLVSNDNHTVTALPCPVLPCSALYCAILYYTVLIMFYYTALSLIAYCTALYLMSSIPEGPIKNILPPRIDSRLFLFSICLSMPPLYPGRFISLLISIYLIFRSPFSYPLFRVSRLLSSSSFSFFLSFSSERFPEGD